MIKITLPDGSIREFDKPISAWDVANDISPRLASAALAAKIDGKMSDIATMINEDAEVSLLTFRDEEGQQLFWHSSAHIMAQAVQELFPEVKVTIGPAIENGFYYDFDREDSFTEAELEKIEKKMIEIAQGKHKYDRKELSRNDALALFKEMDEPYKVEILSAIPETDIISIYQQDKFVDLCRGPHLPDTGKMKAVKLTKTSGAYWRGDEKNKMLKRIYGISFPSSKELRIYLKNVEEAKKRDHRKLGKELDLFSVSEDVGPGLILWHPNGAMMRHLIESYWKDQHLKSGYKLVYTPHIGKASLWETSGHLGFYNEGMFPAIDVEGQDYYLKPMNCPFHIAIYNTQKRSYKELPIRLGELGTVYRYERSGTLHGLMRVRGFTQDDAHIICTPDQLDGEVERLITFSLKILTKFGFKDMDIYLSTMPEKSVGVKEEWDVATESLRKAIEKAGLDYKVDEGGGAFYGPKIDIKIKDALNRSWQCTTIQFDFNLPTRFNMEYIGADNQPHRPYMVHRALLGSIERFFGTLIEYHAGNFPVWLCPVQVQVIPISDQYIEYAKTVQDKLLQLNVRADIDVRDERVGYKIRDAEMKKIPYMFIVGSKESESGTVSVRRHTEGDLGSLTVDEAINAIRLELEKE
ncbi:MAG: threonine--tRNA ligase [Candidatus Zophobacter franzmannii]|nr:threonine--tRNA ligase [Candidatus Zophobacter franzmannii]